MNEVDRSQIGEGRYANYAEVGHNAHEFVFDFGQVWARGDPAHMVLRVITSPETAERMCQLLSDALGKYRAAYGEIRREDDVSGGTE